MLRYVVAVYAVTVIGTARCDGPASSEPVDKRHANRRSVGGDHHHHGPLYAPSYYGHYAPAAYPAGHYHAPQYHVHGLAAAPDHHHAHGYAGPAYYHAAGGHYHFGHEAAATVHGRHPIVYQSVVNTYPTATAVVHRPVPVPVPVAHPVPVPVDRPVPVEVPRPYPVPVNRPYPVAVVRPVPVPVAQPYPVYRPYPVPAYRPPVARPVAAVRLPVAVRAPPHVRYPPQPASYVHSHRVYAAPHAHVYAPAHSYGYATLARPYYRGPPSPVYPAAAPAPVSSYLQQLAAVRGAQEGAEYDDATEAAAAAAVQQQQQQQAFQEDYQQFGQQDVADDSAIRYRQEQQLQIGQDGGYPSLTVDDSFKTTGSLGVPSTDYAGKKK